MDSRLLAIWFSLLDHFSLWWNPLIQMEQQWVIFDFNETSPNHYGGQQSLDSQIVPQGTISCFEKVHNLCFSFMNIFMVLQIAAPYQLL